MRTSLYVHEQCKLLQTYPKMCETVYHCSENSNILQTFSNEMTNAIKGLDNLKATYKTDVTVQSKLNVVIEKMKVRVSQISRLLKIQPQRYPLPTPPPNKPTRR